MLPPSQHLAVHHKSWKQGVRKAYVVKRASKQSSEVCREMKVHVSQVCIRQKRVQVEALQGLLSHMEAAGTHPAGLGSHSRAAAEGPPGATPSGTTRLAQAQGDAAAEATTPGLDVILSKFTPRYTNQGLRP